MHWSLSIVHYSLRNVYWSLAAGHWSPAHVHYALRNVHQSPGNVQLALHNVYYSLPVVHYFLLCLHSNNCGKRKRQKIPCDAQVCKKDAQAFSTFRKTKRKDMSYTRNNLLDLELREVLFLLLARMSITFIKTKMHCSPRKIKYCIARLMFIFCGEGRTDAVLIYRLAKNDSKLCHDLAEEFGSRYPDLADIVERHASVTFEQKEKDGEIKWYIHRQ